MGQNPNGPSQVARRRSQRVLMQVAVRIRGADVQGKNIEEETETLAINAHGALVLMKARLTSGSRVLLQHKRTEEKQECHVAFLGPVRAGKAEIGLEFSSPRHRKSTPRACQVFGRHPSTRDMPSRFVHRES